MKPFLYQASYDSKKSISTFHFYIQHSFFSLKLLNFLKSKLSYIKSYDVNVNFEESSYIVTIKHPKNLFFPKPDSYFHELYIDMFSDFIEDYSFVA